MKAKRAVGNKKQRVSGASGDDPEDAVADASARGPQGWLKEAFPGPWHEFPSGWPFQAAQTYHRSGRGRNLDGGSEPHQRTNAIQFALEKFQRINNATVDFRFVLSHLNTWTAAITHRHLRLGEVFNLPLIDHDCDWVRTSLDEAANDAPLWTSGVTADMLQDLLPERRTNWSELGSSYSIDILTCASTWCSTHIHATTSMIILVVTGATTISWMTKAQYFKVLTDCTYSSTTSLTSLTNDRHVMFLRNACPGEARNV